MIGGDSTKSRTDIDVFCDTEADVADLEQYGRDHGFQIGASAYVIDTGNLYLMKSDFSWKKQ